MPLSGVQQSVPNSPAMPTEPAGSAGQMIDTSLRNHARRVASLVMHPWLGVYTIDAPLGESRVKVVVLDDGTTLSYFKELIDNEGVAVSRGGIVSAFKAPMCVWDDADIVVVGANQLLLDRYASRGFSIVPKWVRLYLPVREEIYPRIYNLGRQARKYFKWMIRKTEDAGLECEIITDPSWLDRFYYDMYKPYAEQRFGDRAVVHKRAVIKKSFERGAIGIVKKSGEPVVGTVIYREGDIQYMPHTGVTGGSSEAMKDGAAFALDYYLAQHAHSEGCAFVDFGHSRPFMSDGTLKYKMNWHMDVLPDDDGTGVFAIATPGNTSQAAEFLSANPHFYLTESGCRSSSESSAEPGGDDSAPAHSDS